MPTINRVAWLVFVAALALFSAQAAAQDTYFDLVGMSSASAGKASGASSLVPMSPLPAAEFDRGLPRVPTVDLTSEPGDIWERIRNGFAMPNLETDVVTEQQAFYLNRPQYLARIVERSRRYLHHIVEEIERRGLPTELALLPMVESAYNPLALSPAQASGLWQFIPSTAKNFQLKQTWWIDQRRDILASTSAALDYLQTIYEMHGDWHLALASYNWGEGAVGRAIEKNRSRNLPTDYLSLTLPPETRNYVPKLQALKNIIAQPQLFGITLDAIPNRPYFATVVRPEQMDVAVAAQLAEIPVEEFKALNPAYNRPVANGQPRLVLPVGKVTTFLANLEGYAKPLSNWTTYTLGPKDRLDRVAVRFGTNLARLKEVNGIGPRAPVTTGQTLLVPAGIDRGPAAVADTPTRPVAVARRLASAKHSPVVATRHARVVRKPAAQPTKLAASGAKKRVAVTAKPKHDSPRIIARNSRHP